MADDFDVIHLDQEDVQEIIDWAVSAGAMVTLMHATPDPENAEETKERLEGFYQAVEIMFHNLPHVMEHPTQRVAEETLETARAEEEAVEQFRDELKDL